ncbi:response regulator transcription factor [Leptolyngbya cf. ectocarpi LEGE 11479]|uniref:Response regulator transcription factor n=1 Tax=Leptolyngbya cf. ectocarpi LEGE 11479 TaxID=1828722 RepID=A0A928X0Q3_LEPEC|nr:response regulator transcription factor [Leptolyngbya ectocarpi]MBE9065266.1 response regulator transcription factor [Leptolyngbya cf. ectocarpi LEGE 11479]
MSDIRIALVEDHDLTRMGLRAALKQAGFDFVGEAANGTDGLALLETRMPDVALVDIGLPDMDGIELIKRFRENQPQAATRILMLTMHDSEKAVLAAFAAGADSYSTKEIETDDLVHAVRETHEGNAWIDPAIASIVLQQMRQPLGAGVGIEDRTVEIRAVEPEYEQIIETYPLTDRELEILELIVSGCSNAQIAEKLFITVGTVKTHVRNILNKLGANDRTQAAVRALRSGLIS